jgi:glycine/D-amino acid oxidase-like deaminating enzyme
MRELSCDVVVVGCGAAGLTAALAALQNSAKVIVLERSTVDDRGGNTRWTEALLRMTLDGDPFIRINSHSSRGSSRRWSWQGTTATINMNSTHWRIARKQCNDKSFQNFSSALTRSSTTIWFVLG